MRIQHNIAALNAHRQLGNNNTAVAKNLEKLSSGYKINRAGDDAAGLAISEKMRAQITGLETAQSNANDGISLIQTAEGALTEVHSMLNRMVELSEQSANGTYQDTVDRDNLQKEFDSLRNEIDRISAGTNFNRINLLDGSLGGGKVASTVGTAGTAGGASTPGAAPATTPAKVSTVTAVEGDGTDAGTLTVDLAGMTITAPTDGSTGAKAKITIGGQDIEINVTANMTDKQIATALIGKSITIGGTGKGGTELVAKKGSNDTQIIFEAKTNAVTTDLTGANTNVAIACVAGTIAGGAAVDGTATTTVLDFDGRSGKDLIGGNVKIGNNTYSFVKAAGDAAAGTTAVVLADNATATQIADAMKTAMDTTGVTGFTATAANGKLTLTEDKDAVTNVYSGKDAPAVAFSGVGLTLQIGDTADSYNQLTVNVGSMNSSALGIDAIDIGTQSGAKGSLQTIKDAIDMVSSTRGDLGALQNRLEHTINNLGVASENMSAAESRIRDVDMAKEMMNFTKNNILTQASQAMLAQANQLPQGVLQLLQ